MWASRPWLIFEVRVSFLGAIEQALHSVDGNGDLSQHTVNVSNDCRRSSASTLLVEDDGSKVLVRN